MNKNSFIQGSIFMIAMNFLMRIIGFTYDIFLSNLLGAQALGFFQIAMSTLMTFLIFTTSGIPTCLTKVIAEENSKVNSDNVESIFRVTLIFNLCLSLFLSGILVFFSDFIASKMLRSRDMVIGVYLMVPALIIHSLSNIFKAYFYGIRNMVFPSLAQIIEHLSRFIIVISLLSYLGLRNPLHNAIIAIMGISIGEFFDLLWSYLAKRHLSRKRVKKRGPQSNPLPFLLKILSMSLPVTIASSFGVMLRFSNSILIPNRLMVAGHSQVYAVATFGRVMGMTMPLISLTYIVTSALVTNLIPNLSEGLARKRYRDIKRNIHLSLKASILISFPLAAIYTVFSEPLAILLYKDPLVAPFIRIMGLSTILMAIQHIQTGILLGLNKQLNNTINGMIAMAIRLTLTYILVGNPKFGIKGFFIAFYASLGINILLDSISLKKVLRLDIDYLDLLGKPFLAVAFMLGSSYLSIYDFNKIQNLSPLSFLSSLLVGCLAYILVLVLTKAIPKKLIKRLLKSN